MENYSIKQYNSIVLYKRWPGGVIASEILFWEHFMRNAQKLTRIAYQTQFMTFLIVWEFLFQNQFYDVEATTKFKSVNLKGTFINCILQRKGFLKSRQT